MRGEHPDPMVLSWAIWGSSPHARGTLIGVERVDGASGIIPACAGNTDAEYEIQAMQWDHPRMRGEHMWRVMWVTV